MKLTTEFGIDIFLNNPIYKDLRIALVCNLASITSDNIHSRFALLNSGFNLVKLFAPEHGFDTAGDDGAFINHQIDVSTQLPIISLYSEKLAPSKEDLEDIDLIIIDLPDIGVRFYTYLWTMSYILESCEKQQKKVLLLDRPNPLAQSIDLVEGPLLDNQCTSFIGRFPIPVTHQATFGELANYFKDTYYPNLQLEIIKMKNWQRGIDNNYEFFPTSPAIQNRKTIYTYAGACLFEGLNINEGRGTEFPFTQFGAPWIDAELLYTALDKLQGAELKIVHYIPTSNYYANELCHGIHITPKVPLQFQSFQYYIDVIRIIYFLFPKQLKERNYLTNVNPKGTKHLDKLIGMPNAFKLLQEGKINTKLQNIEWKDSIEPYLLY